MAVDPSQGFENTLAAPAGSYDPKTLNAMILEYLKGQQNKPKQNMQFIGKTAPLGVAGELLQDIGQRRQLQQMMGQQQEGFQRSNDALSASPLGNSSSDNLSSPLSDGSKPTPSASSLPTDTSATPSGGSSNPDTGNSAYQAAMRMSSQGETSKFGTQALTNISPDTGGSKSYGPWGVNSKTGSAAEFGRTYPHLGLTAHPGTPEFDQQWINAAKANPTAMLDAHQDWYHNKYFSPVTKTLTSAGINPQIASNPGVQAYMADRTLQMGGAGQSKALAAAQGTTTPQDFLKTVSQVDSANIPINFRSYLSTNPNNIRGLQNRINLRLQQSLGLTNPSQDTAGTANAPTGNPAVAGPPQVAPQPSAGGPVPTGAPAPPMAPTGMPGGPPTPPPPQASYLGQMGQPSPGGGMPPQASLSRPQAPWPPGPGANMPLPPMAQAQVAALNGGAAPGGATAPQAPAPGPGGASAAAPFNPTGQPSLGASMPPQAAPLRVASLGAASPTPSSPTHGKPDTEVPPQQVAQAQPAKPTIKADPEAVRNFESAWANQVNILRRTPPGSPEHAAAETALGKLREQATTYEYKADPTTGYTLYGNALKGFHPTDFPRVETAPEKFEREKTFENQLAGKLKQTEADQKYFGSVYTGLTGSGAIAANQKQNIAALWEIANDPTFASGFGSNAWLKMQRMGATLGVPELDKQASPREAFNLLAARVLLDQFSGLNSLSKEAGEQGGRIFKPMLDIEEKANITADDSIEGIKRKLRLLDRAGNLMMKFGDMADDYKQAHNTLDPGFNKQFRSEMAKSRITGAYSDHDKEHSAIPEESEQKSPPPAPSKVPKVPPAPPPGPGASNTPPPSPGSGPWQPGGGPPVNPSKADELAWSLMTGDNPQANPDVAKTFNKANAAAMALTPNPLTIGGLGLARAGVRAPGQVINKILGTTDEHTKFIGPLTTAGLAAGEYGSGGAGSAHIWNIIKYLLGEK